MVIPTAGIILVNSHFVLLQQRDDNPKIDWPGLWTIPGGKVNIDEKAEEAATREFKEETGYKVEKYVFLALFPYTYKKEKRTFSVFFASYDAKQKIRCYEGKKMEWVDLNRFEELKMIPVAKKALRIFRNGQIF